MANESDYELACLLMVFVAVSIPTLAKKEASVFKASLEGMERPRRMLLSLSLSVSLSLSLSLSLLAML